MKGPYKDIQLNNFAGGLATRKEDNFIDDNQSPDLQNIVFDGAASITPRLGEVLFGVSSSVVGSIKNTWVTINNLNQEVPVRVVNTSGSAWLEYYNYHTTAWETLDQGYTTGYDFGHADYDYYTYYCSQKDSQRRWNGAIWQTSTYADSAYAKIYINTSAASALGFLSAGSVVIDGTELYYASLSGNALSGITFTGAINGNVAIAQLPTSAGEVPAPDGGWVSATSTIPKGSIMLEKDAQMFVAGASGLAGNVLYYSAIDEPVNYAISAVPGGGGTARYPEAGGSITALNDYDTLLAVLKENTIRSLQFQELADGTAGSIEIVSRDNIVTGQNVGAVNHKSLAKIENDTAFVAANGWVKSLNKTDAGNNINELSINIRPTVESYVMTSASGIYFGGKYYLACNDGTGTFNNTVLVYDYDYKAWTKFKGWNVNDWFIYDKTLHYGASNEIATYKVLTTYSDKGLPFNAYWASKWFDFGVPNEQKRLNRIYIEGYITTNTTIGVSALFDGNSTGVAKSIVGSSDYVDTSITQTMIGFNTWGKGTYGGETGATAYNLKKFRVNLIYPSTPFYNMQIRIGTASPEYVWKITHIVPYLAQLPGKRTLNKTLI